MITTKNVSGVVAETFIYQSGKNKYTQTMNNKIGTQKRNAIGKPRNSLLLKLLCISRFSDQYFIKRCSSSDNMPQK